MGKITVRPAKTTDIKWMHKQMDPLVTDRILLGKELVQLFESVQEFLVAEDESGERLGFGALHVFWEDLGEVRTLAVPEEYRRMGVGQALLNGLEEAALTLGLKRLFCLTFEVEFFSKNGYEVVDEQIVSDQVYTQIVRSVDDGVAEFLDLARVKANTLGNSRMLKELVTA